MSKKLIKMICYGNIAFGTQYNSIWEDVWIEYYIGKRRKIQEGPCILGCYNLCCEINNNLEFAKKYPNRKKRYLEELNNLYIIQSKFSNGERFSFLSKYDILSNTPNIYVNQEFVDRKISEQAVSWYLKNKGILKSLPKFKWKKPKYYVQTVSLGCKT